MAELAAAEARVAILEAQLDEAHLARDAPPVVVAAAAVKLPPFWPAEPLGWFVQAESQFATKNVTVDQTKYDHLVSSLDKETVTRVLDLLVAPPNVNRYETLKTRLIGSLSLTRRDRAAKLHELGPLGDESAVARLDRMQALRGLEPMDILWEELFLRQLPESVRSTLSTHPMTDMQAFAKLADQVILSQRNARAIGAVQSGLAIQPQRSGTNDICKNHRRFGNQTYSCGRPDSCRMAKVLIPKPAESKNAREPRL